MIVAPDLELRIQVQIQKDETREGRSGVARGKRFEGIIDLVLISGADCSIVHDLTQSISCFLESLSGDAWLADGQEVRSKSADEPFEEDLEYSRCD